MVLIIVSAAVAIVTVAECVADNLAYILLELATIPIVTPAAIGSSAILCL